MNTAMNMNQYTVQDTNLPSNSDEFSKNLAGTVVLLLLNLFSGYDQIKLDVELCDIIAFQTLLGLL